MDEQGRQDVLAAFPKAQEARRQGFQGALDVFGQSIPQQLQAFQGGNVGAQQALLGGLPQQQNAILGLPTDLSTGYAMCFGSVALDIKDLTLASRNHSRTADQKTTRSLEALYLKALSKVLPSYPQPLPHQKWTTQNPEKTAACSDFVSRLKGSARKVFHKGLDKKKPRIAGRFHQG